METWQQLDKQWERLRWARLNRSPFQRSKDAAESLGIKPGTYRTYEHAPIIDGGRLPPFSELQRICRKFKVNWIWVMTGQGDPDSTVIADDRLVLVSQRLDNVPEEKQEDALRAALGVLDAFQKVG